MVLPLEVDDPPSALHFDTYVHARSGALLRLAFLLTGDAHHAEDLVQTTLVKVMGRWEQVTAGGDPHAYVRKVLLHTDSAPGHLYHGKVGFVSPTAEFTPKNVETPELRTALVYRARVVVSDPDSNLRQGMPVTVVLDDAR